jgi:lipopolysaccharide/colanic/teichoic acid biosynthesis glycosyltransferase
VQRLRPIKSEQTFKDALYRERAVCDRTGNRFSVITFHVGTPGGNLALIRDLVRVLNYRIRQTDEQGWFDKTCFGLLLPATSLKGAQTLARDISTLVSAPLVYSIYTYPDQWPIPHFHDRCDPLFATSTPAWKRLIDVAGAGTGLLLLSPIMLLTAVLIKLTSAGPVLLKQQRVGRNGKIFTLFKFRTMRRDADATVHQGHVLKLIAGNGPMVKLDAAQDSRIFPLGRILRRTYLDELPQLINVLIGNMSLVGPRPCLPYEAKEYRSWHYRRFDSSPGMTGLWQVSGKNQTTFQEMMRMDIAYSRRRTPWLDSALLLKTIPAIVTEFRSERSGKSRRDNHRKDAANDLRPGRNA